MAAGYYVGGYASGHPVMVPVVDVVEVGAGGGSIAWIDEVGALKVGPQSAGADPGPICYRGGGDEPTITDANVVLGRLESRRLSRRRDEARRRGALRGIAEKIAAPLKLDAIAAAHAHHRDRGRQDVAGGARGLGREGLRPARFRARRLGRRGAAARHGDRARAAHPDRDRAAASRRISRRSACCSRTSGTISSAPITPISSGSISRRSPRIHDDMVEEAAARAARRRRGARYADPSRHPLCRSGIHASVPVGDRADPQRPTAPASAPRSMRSTSSATRTCAGRAGRDRQYAARRDRPAAAARVSAPRTQAASPCPSAARKVHLDGPARRSNARSIAARRCRRMRGSTVPAIIQEYGTTTVLFRGDRARGGADRANSSSRWERR